MTLEGGRRRGGDLVVGDEGSCRRGRGRGGGGGGGGGSGAGAGGDCEWA